MPTYRVKWDYDPEPDLSHLEQWDTPEKYYGADKVPTCSHGEKMKYDAKHVWKSDCVTCADTDRVQAKRYDGKDSHLGGYMVDRENGTGIGPHHIVPFEVYIRYHGNPDEHTMLYARVERKCDHCNSWVEAASLYGVDFMVNDTWATGTFTESDAVLMAGYQAEVSKELLDEAKAQ